MRREMRRIEEHPGEKPVLLPFFFPLLISADNAQRYRITSSLDFSGPAGVHFIFLPGAHARIV